MPSSFSLVGKVTRTVRPSTVMVAIRSCLTEDAGDLGLTEVGRVPDSQSQHAHDATDAGDGE